MSSKKLKNSSILEELLVAVTGQKLCYACEKSPYNVFIFVRNYFVSVGCSCYSADKELICEFCSHLKENLNYHVMKACIEVSDKNNLPFQVIPLKNTCVI